MMVNHATKLIAAACCLANLHAKDTVKVFVPAGENAGGHGLFYRNSAEAMDRAWIGISKVRE